MKGDRQTNNSLWRRGFLDRKAPFLILFIALILGLFIWTADAVLDYFVFYEGGFFELLLLSPPRHEIYIRFLILLCFLGFGGVVSGVVLNLQASRNELQNKEISLRTTLHSIGDAVIATDTSGRVQRMNVQSESLTGWGLPEAQGLPLERVFRIVNAISREPVANPVQRVLEEGTVQGLANHTALIARDGTEYQIADSAAPIRSDEGSITGVVLVFRDVTEQYRQEDLLRKQRRRLANVVDGTDAGIWERNIQTRELFFDTAWLGHLGYDPEEFSDMDLYMWRDLLHPEDLEKSDRFIAEHMSGYLEAYECEIRVRRRDGSWAWVLDRGKVSERTSDEEPLLLSGTVQDITERKRSEEALKESQRQLSTLMGNLPGMAYRCLNDPYWTMLFVSDGCLGLTGYSPEDLIENRTLCYADLIRPEEEDRIWEKVQHGLDQSGSFAVEYRIVTAEGEEKHVWEQGTGVYEEERLVFLEGFITDITERKLVEEEVNHLNQLLRAARNVNQLIAEEKNKDRLIQRVCDNLVETRGYDNAWIALLDESGDFASFAGTGQERDLDSLPERCQQSELPYCARKALDQSDLVLVHVSADTCADCPLSDDPESYACIAVPLKHTYTNYGVLSLSLPNHFALQEEQDLVRELGDDIGLALYSIELEGRRRQHESEQEITLRLLRQLHRYHSVPDLASGVTSLLKEWSGCEAVGIRLQQGADYPYYETRGFPEEHIRLENSLCKVDAQGEVLRDFQGNPVLECMCGSVIRGRFDAGLPFFTEQGSFWTNNTTDLLASFSEEDRLAGTRNRCNGEAYESVALIPLRYGEQTLGLLQFNDSRRNQFTEVWIHLLERLAENLALGVVQRQTEDSLREREYHFRQLFEQAPIGIFIASEEHTVVETNQTALSILGYSREELIRLSAWDIIHPDDLKANSPESSLQRMLSSEFVDMERRFRTRQGGYIHALVKMAKLPYYSEEASHMVMFEDISERKQAEERIYYLAYYDDLTGLPNRRFFHQRLKQVAASSEYFGICGVVFLVDITRLRTVNDTLGQQAGDELIKEVARRLSSTVGEHDTLARVSGGEFMILSEGRDNTARGHKIGWYILEEIGKKLELSGRLVYPEVNIGFTLFPQRGTEPDTLSKQADMALRETQKGAHYIQEFVWEEDWISRQFHLEHDLKQALANEEFTLYYQTQIDLQSGRIVGLEALIRWKHPERGIVSPGEFIPLLEHTGMIGSVDEWVIDRVCEQLKSWQEGGTFVKTSVNLSAQEFNNDAIKEVVRTALKENDLPSGMLEVEITETGLMENVDRASQILQTFSSWGVKVALDDFGTGYSCMSYLQKLAINTIKIDKEFVNGLPENVDSVTLAQTIIAMAHNLGKKVLAEGVEREEQWQKLRELGCDYGQGFLWSRPQPVENLSLTEN